MFEYYVYSKIKFQFQILSNFNKNIASFCIFPTQSPQTTAGHTLNLVILDKLIVVKLVVCVAQLKLILVSRIAVHLHILPLSLHSADWATVEQKDTPKPLVSYMHLVRYGLFHRRVNSSSLKGTYHPIFSLPGKKKSWKGRKGMLMKTVCAVWFVDR